MSRSPTMDHLAPEVTAVACIGQVRSLHDRGPKTSCELVAQTTETQNVRLTADCAVP